MIVSHSLALYSTSLQVRQNEVNTLVKSQALSLNQHFHLPVWQTSLVIYYEKQVLETMSVLMDIRLLMLTSQISGSQTFQLLAHKIIPAETGEPDYCLLNYTFIATKRFTNAFVKVFYSFWNVYSVCHS